MEVNIGCPCPGTPHPDGDIVTLRDKPNLQMGMKVIAIISQGQTDPSQAMALTSQLAEVFLTDGILEWTLVDEGGPVPVDPTTVHDFCQDFTFAYPVAEAASGLYSSPIFDPLVPKTLTSSKPSRTGGSTSRNSPSRLKPLSPSEPSSPDTTEATTPSIG